MNRAAEPSHGHRLLPHTADVLVEAWGRDEVACAEQAAQALIEVCVSGTPDPAAGVRVSRFETAPKDLVRAVLEEVVFVLDTSDLIPVAATVDRDSDSTVAVTLALAGRDSARFTGSVPKAIVMQSHDPGDSGTPARCRFIVDV